MPITTQELLEKTSKGQPVVFAIDLGNTLTKLKSPAGEWTGLSQYLPMSNYGQATMVAGTSKGIVEVKIPGVDETILWGPDLDKLPVTDILTDTRTDIDRYRQAEYQNMFDIALAYLAFQTFQGQPADFNVSLVIGLPTDDYASGIYNADLAGFLKKTHTVEVFGIPYNITVENLTSLGQSQGTLYDLRFDDYANDIHPEYTEETTTIVDYGGGTILYDQYAYGMSNKKSKQTPEGAYKLAEDVAHAYNSSELAKQYKAKLTRNDIISMLRKHIDGEPFNYKYNAGTFIDLTEFVNAESKRATETIIKELKSLDDWDKSEYVVITGGGAHLVDQEMLTDFMAEVKLQPMIISESEYANVRGFYKVGLATTQGASELHAAFNKD